MLSLCVWINRHSDKRDLRVYLNGHDFQDVKIYFTRAHRPKGSMKFHWKLSYPNDSVPPPRKAIQQVVDQVCEEYGLDQNRTHWYKMLCVAEWPHYYDRAGELAIIEERIRPKGSKKRSQGVKPDMTDDDVPKARRRIIRD